MTSGVLLRAVLTGSIQPLGPKGAPSGIAKAPAAGSLRLTATGLEGDAQGDPKNHGGPEKAVHHYPFDHYATWKGEIGDHELLARAGGFGENLSTSSLTEDDVSIGDVFEIGSAVVEVAQGRQPCWKLNERFGRKDMAKLVQSTGRTGWYYRVLREGVVEAGNEVRRVERKCAEWTIARVWRVFYIDMLNRDELARLSELEPLASGWRDYALKRLRSGKVEDWTSRLTGAS